MYKYVDYTMNAEETNATTSKPKSLLCSEELMSAFVKEIERYFAQFHIIKDEARRYKLENEYFVRLCRLAEIQGAAVELNINEDYYIGTLSYIGKELIMDRAFRLEMLQFIQIMQDADTFSVDAKGENFILTFTFEMNQMIKR